MKFNINALRAFWAQFKLTAQTQFEQGKQAQMNRINRKLWEKREKERAKEEETNGRVPK